jgi:hypothetical protein
MGSTHYATMGVRRDASSGEIRRAYLARARERHPDMPGGSDGAMSDLNAAFAVLSDPKERKSYDRSIGVAGAGAGAVESRGTTAPGHYDEGHSHDPVELNDDGQELSLAMRFFTKAVPLLFVAAFGVMVVGAMLQVEPMFAAGIAMGVASLVLFALMPFFAMSARKR